MEFEKLTPEDIVDGFVLTEELSPAEQREANQKLAEIRQKRLLQCTPAQERYARLMQLRFQMESYIEKDEYDPTQNFSNYFKSYLSLYPESKKEFAAELDIHNSLLSQLLAGTRAPSESFLVRLEIHSRYLVPAVYWLKLLTKEREHNLSVNSELQSQERLHVKKQLEVSPFEQ